MNYHDTHAADQIRRVAPAGVDVIVIGEQAGLPVHRFGLDDTAAAHDAVEGAAVGRVLITVSG